MSGDAAYFFLTAIATVPAQATGRIAGAYRATMDVGPSASLLVDSIAGEVYMGVAEGATLDMKDATSAQVSGAGTMSGTGSGLGMYVTASGGRVYGSGTRVFVGAFTTGAIAVADGVDVDVNAAYGGVGTMRGDGGMVSYGRK